MMWRPLVVAAAMVCGVDATATPITIAWEGTIHEIATVGANPFKGAKLGDAVRVVQRFDRAAPGAVETSFSATAYETRTLSASPPLSVGPTYVTINGFTLGSPGTGIASFAMGVRKSDGAEFVQSFAGHIEQAGDLATTAQLQLLAIDTDVFDFLGIGALIAHDFDAANTAGPSFVRFTQSHQDGTPIFDFYALLDPAALRITVWTDDYPVSVPEPATMGLLLGTAFLLGPAVWRQRPSHPLASA